MNTLRDENGHPLIGHVDVAGISVPRNELIKILPDVSRFMYYLEDAQLFGKHAGECMRRGGPGSELMPPEAEYWSSTYLRRVLKTFCEIGQVKRHMEAKQ